MKKTPPAKNGRITTNGRTGQPAFNQLLATNLMLERKLWLSRLLDPRRDIDKECGHPEVILTEDYARKFERGDIATRVVSIWPEESWAVAPEIYESESRENETAFEKAWDTLNEEHQLLTILQRIDVLSGIGRFGILLIGTDDGLALSEEVPKRTSAKLLYLRAFDETLVKVKDFETNVTNPRYGLPKSYQVSFSEETQGVTLSQTKLSTMDVHWTRVVHIADNRTSSEVYGTPRMKSVFNRLCDISKIAGGSGEMFWKGGFPGLSLETMPNIEEGAEFDVDATKEQLDAYMNGLQRYIATIGMQAKSLTVQVADPGPHVDIQVRLIAMALGVPWRVFMGSEAAQLASEQDSRAWNRRVTGRRERYLTPFVIRPFGQRLIDLGILPTPKEWHVAWPDLNASSDLDKATIAEKRTNALSKYVQAGADVLIPPLFYLTSILGMEEDEAKKIIDEVGDRLMEIDEDEDEEPMPPTAKKQRP